MNATSALIFQWSSWTVLLGLLAILITSIASALAVYRSGWKRSVVGMECLRMILVTAAVLLLNQPEWVESFRPKSKPAIVVLSDDSDSMSNRDSVVRQGQTNTAITRREAIAPWMEKSAWMDLNDRFEVILQKLPNDTESGGTNLHQPLMAARDQYPHLRGIVLMSDGDWNAGLPPVQAAMRMRLEDIPIFTVPVGSTTRLPDVELLSLDAPTFGIAGKSVRVPFTIESALPRDYTAHLTLKASDGQEVHHEVRVAAMGRTSDALVWKPEKIGDYTLTLTVPTQPEELILDNNTRTAPIAIREEKLKVLVIESYPRWEYRYLRNALSRDPGVQVHCLLFHPGLSKLGGGNKDYIASFPDSLDQLAQYDVVFLGDVGIDDGQLSEEQCRLLKGLVEQQASGLVFMPGWQGRQASLQQTALNDLYPVLVDNSQSQGWGSRSPSHFELTESGRRSLLTKLADTPEENMRIWEGLPGFQWHAPILRAKAGTEILAVHRDSSNAYGHVPLLVTRTFGTGKILFMGTDGAWRWRKGVEDLYHYRFWGQVVRWMAYQRNMAKGESMRLYYWPEQPQVRQTVSLNANVMERSGEPLAKGEVVARLVAPSGKGETVRLASEGSEWGKFSGPFLPKEPGQHRVALHCTETDATLETNLFVQGAALERLGKPARPEVLQELARVSKGKVLDLNQHQQILDSLARLPEPTPEIRRIQLWSHPWIAATLIGAMGLFWVIRKAMGLI